MSLKETISTLTNIVYVFVGIMTLNVYWLAGVSLIILGFSSAWYHATKTRLSQSFDVASIYFTFNATIAYFLSFYGIESWVLVPSVLAVSAGMAYYVIQLDSVKVIPIQFLVTTLLVASLGMGMGYIFFFVMGLVFNIPYLMFPEKVPHEFHDVTHALWHIFTGMGYYLLLIQ